MNTPDQQSSLNIWVDADGCPKAIREVIQKAAMRRSIRTILVANYTIKIPRHPCLSMRVVTGDFDAADDWIVEETGADDLVITADIPLADRVVERQALALTHRGEVLDQRNIKDRLSTRNLLTEMRGGLPTGGGPPPLSAKDVQTFANAFDRVVTKLIRIHQRRIQQEKTAAPTTS